MDKTYSPTLVYHPALATGLTVDPTGAIRPGTKKTSVRWIIIHEAGNSSVNAGADNHLLYLKNLTASNLATYNMNKRLGKTGNALYDGLKYISFNYFVQGNIKGQSNTGKVYNIIPDEEIAWCNTDGTTPGGGNMCGISIEIADSVSYDMEDGYRRAIELVAYLLNKHGLDRSAIKAHRDFYPVKTCPYQLLTNNRFDWFKDQCIAKYNEVYKGVTTPGEKPKEESKDTPLQTYKVGDEVTITGRIYASAWKAGNSIEVKDKKFKITEIIAYNNPTAPYKLGSVGYVDSATIAGSNNAIWVPSVGDKVSVTGNVYASAWKAGNYYTVKDKQLAITGIITANNPTAPYRVGAIGYVEKDSLKKV
ncbi:MAG: peptidoglycan recognition family protein [Herbinix sp.]|nr:peptidoglycan recognition family protein [Herbinix sp.]